jgi:predicted transcriptional regulator
MKKPKPTDKLLTEVELELMNILWRRGEGSVADVIGQLPEARDLAYTSVSTILRILEQKGVLRIRKEGRGHVYIPKLTKSDYEAKTVRHVINRVFDGAPAALVRQLLTSGDLDATEIAALKELISEHGTK